MSGSVMGWVLNNPLHVDDNVAPVPVITGPASPWDGAKTVTITFTNGVGGDPEAVEGFVVGDLVGTNCSLSNFTQVADGVYEADATPTNRGTVTVKVNAGACTDMAGNLCTESNTLSVTFTPVLSVTANLKLRLKSSVGLYQDTGQTTPVTADGQLVASWDDQSASNWDASQATEAARPTRQTITVGGVTFPVVRGNATAANLSIPSLSLASGSLTIYLAVTGLTGTTLRYYFDSQGGLGRLILAAQTNTSGKVGWFDGTWQSIADAIAGFQILTFKFVTGGNGTLYRNGTSLGSAAFAAQTRAAPTRIFSNGQGNGSWAAVDMAEVLIYTGAHSDADRASVEAYLKATYGLN